MRETKADWGCENLDKLYRGFGFEVRQGKKHLVYKHPEYKYLRATVARHDPLPVGYIETAIELIDRLKELESEDES
jgi:hypothetical protein